MPTTISQEDFTLLQVSKYIKEQGYELLQGLQAHTSNLPVDYFMNSVFHL